MPTDTQDTVANFCWAQPVVSLLSDLGANPGGLSNSEAAACLERFGPNVLRVHRERALILQFLSRFRNPLVIFLLAASAFTGQVTFLHYQRHCADERDAGFIQEYRAGQAVQRRKNEVAVRQRVA